MFLSNLLNSKPRRQSTFPVRVFSGLQGILKQVLCGCFGTGRYCRKRQRSKDPIFAGSGGSGIKDDDIHDLTEMLGLNTIIIEKLDLSENSFSLQGITELVDLFKDKPVQSLYFRNFRSSNIGTLFDSLIQASRNINLGLLDISGSVLSDDAFTGLCALIGSNADIKRLNIKNCRI